MKIGQVWVSGERVPAIQGAGGAWHRVPGAATMDTLIAGGPERVMEAAGALDPEPLEAPSFAAPLRPGKIVAIGLNYADHVRESGMEAPASPLIFAKFPSSVIGPGEPIVA